jgi:hypothetical protein
VAALLPIAVAAQIHQTATTPPFALIDFSTIDSVSCPQENFMNTHFFRKTTTAALAALTISAFAPNFSWAQQTPPSRQERRDTQRERLEQMSPEQRQQYFQGQIQERLKNMTPEQRQRVESLRAQWGEMQRQQQVASVSGEDRQKFLMQSAGVNDPETQNAIIAFVMEQARQRQPSVIF